jgi:hypothetical protein
MRLILGLIKGIIIGGAVGYGAYHLGMGGPWNWVTYGVVGALVGLLVGRPFWSHLVDKNSTVVVALLKGIVGYAIGAGLYAVVAKVWGGMNIEIAPLGETRNLYEWQFLLGAAIGGVYGAWVELDDAPSKQAAEDKKADK